MFSEGNKTLRKREENGESWGRAMRIYSYFESKALFQNISLKPNFKSTQTNTMHEDEYKTNLKFTVIILHICHIHDWILMKVLNSKIP